MSDKKTFPRTMEELLAMDGVEELTPENIDTVGTAAERENAKVDP